MQERRVSRASSSGGASTRSWGKIRGIVIDLAEERTAGATS